MHRDSYEIYFADLVCGLVFEVSGFRNDVTSEYF